MNALALDSPLVAVELAFRSGDQYAPLVIAFTESDKIDAFPVVSGAAARRVIEIPTRDFEPALAEFTEHIASNDKWPAGAKMLREAAALVTSRAGLRAPTADAFVAYAIDWELEGDNFARILTQCGADAKAVRLWRRRGWIT